MLKKSAILLFISLIFIEVFSLIATKLNLLIVNHEPDYIYSQGNKWRIENTNWGSWHKNNFKDMHSTKCFSVKYESNNIGARDNIDYFKNETKKSIILLGDSMAEGFASNLEDTFAKKLESKVKKKILNFGSAAHFGPLQAKILYDEMAKFYNHDEIILFLNLNDDFIDNNWDFWNTKIRRLRHRPYYVINEKNEFDIFYPTQNMSSLKKNFLEFYFLNIQGFLTKYTYTANTLKTLNSVFSKYRTKKNLIDDHVEIKKNLNDIHTYFIEDRLSINGTLFSLEEFFKISKDKKKTVVLIPQVSDLIRIENGEKFKSLYWYKKLNYLLDKYSVKLIDLSEHFSSNEYQKMRHSCDHHWNNLGNLKVADLVYSLNYK